MNSELAQLVREAAYRIRRNKEEPDPNDPRYAFTAALRRLDQIMRLEGWKES